MSDRSGLSRGDRNRNARLARLRQLLPFENAIVGIDLADDKQAAVVTDHDSRVIARRRVSARAWELGELLDWAVAQASAAGFASVTVACEPTGHRWRVLDQLAAERGLALVCVQPLLVYRSREGEDLTRDKSDPKDAVLIARLASELHCYEPERADAVWARLRHLGARRHQLTTDATAQVNQIRDLLECAWPAVLGASGARSGRRPGARRWPWCWTAAPVTWAASCVLARSGSRARSAVSCPGGARPGRACGSCGPSSPRWRDPAGVIAHRPGRAGARAPGAGRLAGHPGPAGRCRGPDGRGPGRPRPDRAGHHDRRAHPGRRRRDPGRDRRPGPLRLPAVAGQARRAVPARQRLRRATRARPPISGRGRPGLRVAAWRAVWAALPNNPVMAARFTYLTTREDNRLARQQARTACAAALLRWIHVVVTRRVTWDPAIAAGSTPLQQAA